VARFVAPRIDVHRPSGPKMSERVAEFVELLTR
jgi:hypothetical protein